MLNKSFTYILPLYDYIFNSIEKLGLRNLYVGLIANTYLYYNNNQSFIIKLENTDDAYLDILQRLKISKYYLEYFEVENYTVIIFSIPNKIWGTYQKIISGLYSRINKKDKLIILNFAKSVFSTDFSIKVHDILYKNKNKRLELEKELCVKIPEDLELSSIIDKELETFKL